jgi:hypothetical protein
MTDLRARLLILLVQRVHIFAVDPHPRPWVALIPLAEEEVATATRDRDKVLTLKVNAEAENLNVVIAAGGGVAHSKYGRNSAESERRGRCGLGHT